MQRTIFLLGNCQIRTIADALRMLFPDDRIIDISSWDFNDKEETAGATQYLRSFDIQIRMPESHCTLKPMHIDSLPHQRMIDIPAIVFPAFHPDLVYACWRDGSNFRSVTDYHSAIGLWAWRAGLDVESASQLFSDEVFAQLGYDRYWTTSAESLREAFDASDLDFSRAWARMVRLGPFMHTVNHPRPEALAVVAKLIAGELGAPPSTFDEPLERYLHDYCESDVWPIYPFVARRLGAAGTWQWRVHDKNFLSIRDWLAACYATYDGASPEDVSCQRLDDLLYDEVLGGRTGLRVSGGR